MVFGSSLFDRAAELNLQNMTGTVRIICGDPYTVFEIHRTLVVNASPFFRNHLAIAKNSDSCTPPVVNIPPHYTARACHEYVKYLYGNPVSHNLSFEVKLEAYLLAKFLGEKTPFLKTCLRAIQSSPPSVCYLSVPAEFFNLVEENDAARQFIIQLIARELLRGVQISQSLDEHLPASAWREICLAVAAESRKASSQPNPPSQSLFSNTSLFGTKVAADNNGTACSLFGNPSNTTQSRPQGGLFGNIPHNIIQNQQQGGLFGNGAASGLFGSKQSDNNTSNLFGVKTKEQNSTNSGLFGSSPGAGGLFGNSSVINPGAWSNTRKPTPPPCSGTQEVPFVPVTEHEWNGRDASFHSISMMPCYNAYSPEELRFGDYQTGQRSSHSQQVDQTRSCTTSQDKTAFGASTFAGHHCVTANKGQANEAEASASSTPCYIPTPTSSRESSPSEAAGNHNVLAQQMQTQTSGSKVAVVSALNGVNNPKESSHTPSKATSSSPFGYPAPFQPGFSLPQFGRTAQPINSTKLTVHNCTPGCDHAVRDPTDTRSRRETGSNNTESEKKLTQASPKSSDDTAEHLNKENKDKNQAIEKTETPTVVITGSDDNADANTTIIPVTSASTATLSAATETDSIAMLHTTVRQLQSQLASSQKALTQLRAQFNVVNAPFEAARQYAAASSTLGFGFGN